MTISWAEQNPSRKKSNAASPQTIMLSLQGGGALGAYQGGAYAAMAEEGIHPDWVSGISIGAINAAIIAGNPPEQVAGKLKGFWDSVSTLYSDPFITGGMGVPHFFKPNLPGSSESLFNPHAMEDTLKKFVDFDYLNQHSKTRLSVGAVNIENGELIYFDSRKNISLEEGMKTRSKGSIMRNPQEFRQCEIEPKHIMASGALIPSFPAVNIDGQFYADGGLISNTPVRAAFETGQIDKNTLVIRADLWSRQGRKPVTVAEAESLRKSLQFSSPPLDLEGKTAGHIHVTMPNRDGQSYNKDFDFSYNAVGKSWAAGYENMKAAIQEYKAEAAVRREGTIETGNGHRDANPAHVSRNSAYTNGAAR